MLRPSTGRPPPKGGAAVRFRRNWRARAGLLSKVALGVKLKHRGGRREGSPGMNSSRSTSRLPPVARGQKPSSNVAAPERYSYSYSLLLARRLGWRQDPQPCALALPRVSTSGLLVRPGCGVASELELDYHMRDPARVLWLSLLFFCYCA